MRLPGWVLALQEATNLVEKFPHLSPGTRVTILTPGTARPPAPAPGCVARGFPRPHTWGWA